MYYVKVGSRCNYTILSRYPVSEDEIKYNTNFQLRLMRNPHVRGAVLEQVVDSVDVAYPKHFHQRLGDSFLYNIGLWNEINVIAHLDDIELMDFQFQRIRMILYLARSGQ